MRCDKGLEKEIDNIIDYDIFKDFDNENYEKGRDKLKKLYLKYYHFTENMNIKWRILYNIIYAENKIYIRSTSDSKKADVHQLIKKHTTMLKNEMETNLKYLKDNRGRYCDVLSYYIPYNKEDLTKSEIINLYSISYDIFEKDLSKKYTERNFLCAISAKFNLYLMLEDEEVVLDILDTLSSLHNSQADLMIEDMFKDMKETNIDLYERIKNNIALAI